MNVKVKRIGPRGKIVRTEGLGEIDDVVINENLLDPDNASVSLFFRGEGSSGIIELTSREMEMLNKEISSKLHLFKGISVLKFKK